MTSKTLKSLYQYLSYYVENEPRLNGIGYGNINNTNTINNIKYPYLCFQTISRNNITNDYDQITNTEVELKIYLRDKLREDKNNYLEIHNELEDVFNSIITYFKSIEENYEQVFEVINSSIDEYEYEENNDRLNGIICTLTLSTLYTSNICNIPFKGDTEFIITGATYN